MVKNLPATQESQVRSLGQEDPLEKEKATHSSIPAWRISWTEEQDIKGQVMRWCFPHKCSEPGVRGEQVGVLPTGTDQRTSSAGVPVSPDSSQSGVRCGQGPSVRETGSPCGQQRDTACGVTCPHCVHVLLFRLNKLDAS